MRQQSRGLNIPVLGCAAFEHVPVRQEAVEVSGLQLRCLLRQWKVRLAKTIFFLPCRPRIGAFAHLFLNLLEQRSSVSGNGSIRPKEKVRFPTYRGVSSYLLEAKLERNEVRLVWATAAQEFACLFI